MRRKIPSFARSFSIPVPPFAAAGQERWGRSEPAVQLSAYRAGQVNGPHLLPSSERPVIGSVLGSLFEGLRSRTEECGYLTVRYMPHGVSQGAVRGRTEVQLVATVELTAENFDS